MTDASNQARTAAIAVLTNAEIKALLPTITLRGEKPKKQVWLTQAEAIIFARAVEAAVVARIGGSEKASSNTAPALPLIQQTAPERIHLCVGDDEYLTEVDFSECTEVAWAKEAAVSVTVPYVRADLAAGATHAAISPGSKPPAEIDRERLVRQYAADPQPKLVGAAGRLLDSMVERIGPAPAAMDKGRCRRCGGEMKPGIAVGQTYTAGAPDLGDVVTISPGGPGRVIECLKCAACGWSVTA